MAWEIANRINRVVCVESLPEWLSGIRCSADEVSRGARGVWPERDVTLKRSMHHPSQHYSGHRGIVGPSKWPLTRLKVLRAPRGAHAVLVSIGHTRFNPN